MTDFHHNIFYSYRGPVSVDHQRDRQLEDNTTKALINVLERCDPGLCTAFLSHFGIPARPPYVFCLQRHRPDRIEVAGKRHRVLLGITPVPSALDERAISSSHPSSTTRPDAWICGRGVAVLVESKLRGDLVPSQCAGHRALLADEQGNPPRMVRCTWSEIYRFFEGQSVWLDEKDKLLVSSFVEYLEFINMSGYVGLKREMFDFFHGPDDLDTRKWICRNLGAFASQVRERVATHEDFYSDLEVGKFNAGSRACWAALGPGVPGYRRVAHQTISLDVTGLTAFVNIELKSSTDRLKENLQARPDEFHSILRELAAGDPYTVVVRQRVKRQAQNYDSLPIMELSSRYLVDERMGEQGICMLANTIQQLALPEMRLERRLPAAELTKESPGGDDVIEKVAAWIVEQHRLVEFVNGPHTST